MSELPTNMSPRTEFVRSMATYLVIACGWSWIWWFAARWALGATPAPARFTPWAALIAIGIAGPTVSAVVTTALRDGAAAVSPLFRKALLWRVAPRWYFVAIAVPILYDAGGVAVVALRGEAVGRFHLPTLGAIAMAFAFALPFGPLCEELGWRGFALPRLQRRYSALASSLWIGVIWWIWHFPLMWMAAGTMISGRPVTVAALLLFLAATCGESVFFTWMANHTKGSVLIAIVIHGGLNAGLGRLLFPELTADIGRSANYAQVVTMWIVAIILIGSFGPSLRRRPADGLERETTLPPNS